MTTEPSFAIPARPTRRYPYDSGVEYEGGTEFELRPDEARTETELVTTVTDILESGPYRFGDFHDLPMPLWLVRDEDTADVFRVAVRGGTVRLHVLPTTESAGLRRFYDRLSDTTPPLSWTVERSVDHAAE